MKSTFAMLAAASCLVPTVAAAQGVYQETTPGVAQQQPDERRNYFQQEVPAPSNALEITVGTAYNQPFGMLQEGVGMPSVANGGIAVDLGVGYRVNPRWGIIGHAQYFDLDAERSLGARGATFGASAQYHFAPGNRVDPWAELGAGYRFMWEDRQSPASNLLSHGPQLARARVGVDFRVSPDLAIGPVVGADATLFLGQDAAQARAIDNPGVATFIFAGIQGRGDILGTTPQRQVAGR